MSKVWWFLFYVGWSGSILQFRQNIIKVGSKSWILTCSSNITLSIPSYTGSALKMELNCFSAYLSLLYFWLHPLAHCSHLWMWACSKICKCNTVCTYCVWTLAHTFPSFPHDHTKTSTPAWVCTLRFCKLSFCQALGNLFQTY